MVRMEDQQIEVVLHRRVGRGPAGEQPVHRFLVDTAVAAVGFPGAKLTPFDHLLDGAQRDVQEFCCGARAVVWLFSQFWIQFHPITRSIDQQLGAQRARRGAFGHATPV